MPANTSPIFELTQHTSCGQITLATTGTNALDKPTINGTQSNNFAKGTAPEVFNAGSNGSRIDMFTIISMSDDGSYNASAAAVIRLFITDSAGSNTYLWKEIYKTAVTGSTTAAEFSMEFIPTMPLLLATGQKVVATVSVMTNSHELLNVWAHGGDF